MMASSYNAKEEDGHHSGSSTHGGTGAAKNKKPDNTAFKQQRLPAWQPILTAGTVLPAFFVIGLLFIPIGIGLYVTSNNIKEYEVQLQFMSTNRLSLVLFQSYCPGFVLTFFFLFLVNCETTWI